MLLVRTLAHPWDTRDPALCRVRVRGEGVLFDQRPSLLTLRQRDFRLCSSDSSVLCHCPTPRRHTCEPCGLSLRSPSYHQPGRRASLYPPLTTKLTNKAGIVCFSFWVGAGAD